MTRHEQQAEVERAARLVWGDNAGQVIVGSKTCSVFPVRGEKDKDGLLWPLISIQHETLAVPAVLAALRLLAVTADAPCYCRLGVSPSWVETGRTGEAESTMITERCRRCGYEHTRKGIHAADLLKLPLDDNEPALRTETKALLQLPNDDV